MLVYFSVQNFRSIKDKVALDLKTAPRLRRMSNHATSPTYDSSLKVLRSALMYGANASGKSNIVKAIAYSKDIITRSSTPSSQLNTDPFILSEKKEKNSSFYYEFTFNKQLFGYGIIINSQRIEHEYFYLYTTKSEICLLDRKYNSETEDYDINSELFDFQDDDNDKKPQIDLELLIKYTPKTKTFISEVKDKELSKKLGKIIYPFQAACGFFYFQLQIIFPETIYAGLSIDLLDSDNNDKNSGHSYIDDISKYDTGIKKITVQKVPLSTFDNDLISEVKKDLSDGLLSSRIINGQEYRFILGGDEEILATKITALHERDNGEDISFSIENESDGTKRLLDLLPTLSLDHFDPNDQGFVYIIDEFERSLHPNLSRNLIKTFLENKHSNPLSQMIVTTHESSLLDNKLLRRDEIWFVQKEKDNSTSLYSLNDYTPRFDKELRKAYLNGVFGAVPIIMDSFSKNESC